MDLKIEKLRYNVYSSSGCLNSQFLGSDFSEFLALHSIHKAEFPAYFKSRFGRQADQQTENLVLSPHQSHLCLALTLPKPLLHIQSLCPVAFRVPSIIYLKVHGQYIFDLKNKNQVSKIELTKIFFWKIFQRKFKQVKHTACSILAQILHLTRF